MLFYFHSFNCKVKFCSSEASVSIVKQKQTPKGASSEIPPFLCQTFGLAYSHTNSSSINRSVILSDNWIKNNYMLFDYSQLSFPQTIILCNKFLRCIWKEFVHNVPCAYISEHFLTLLRNKLENQINLIVFILLHNFSARFNKSYIWF